MKYELPSEIEIRYHGLMKIWHRDTMLLSVIGNNHPCFNGILEINKEIDIIPLVLLDLYDYPHICLKLLYILVEEINRPYFPEKDRGKVDKLKDTWYRWGKEKGYI